MNGDAFVSFWAGAGAGLVIGIMTAAILAAISNSIERRGGDNEESNRPET